MKHIVVKPEKCTGCRLCQLTCSAQNFRLNIHKSARIGIVPRFPDGYFEVHLCNQCGVCLPVCPVEAISVDAKGVYVIDDSMCIDCGACVDSCPQQAIFRSPASLHPYICNLCGACVPNCTSQALTWEEDQ
ncbi:MAG: 4Fe-4S binding protein [Caldiserica bacterium]|nr:4Fe-4S binding protein [Caldisericota bacterium]